MKKILAIALVVVVIAAGLYIGYHVDSGQVASGTGATAIETSTIAGYNGILPDPAKTPGSTNPNISQSNIQFTICNHSWSTKSIRPSVSYTNKLKKQELAAGYTVNGDTNPADYELDHLISLELGGNPTDPKNLWPEPYNIVELGNAVGAHQKDAVENYLHTQVCAGVITLAQAQQEIATNWEQVYMQMVQDTMDSSSNAGSDKIPTLTAPDPDDN